MEQWRKDMNAALGVARATTNENQYNQAIATAKGIANTSGTGQTQRAVISEMGRTFTPTPTQGETKDYTPKVQGGGTSGGSSSGAGGAYYSPTPAPVYVAPPPPAATTYAVKQPAPSLVQYNAEALPEELIIDLLYEDVGGQELINISRHDTVDGQEVSYSLIRNLSIFNQSFNPNNILAGQIAYSPQFGQYSLDISSKLPFMNADYPEGPAYLDTNGNLIIDLISIGADEYIEVEISSNGTIY